jgi:alpha-glucosidase (family GH31 glycosyl hydrolase)
VVKLKHYRSADVVYDKPYYRFKPGAVINEVELTRITKVFKADSCEYFYLGNKVHDSLAIVRFYFYSDAKILFEIRELHPSAVDSLQSAEIEVEFDSDKEDSYMGMGMRYNTTNHYGTIVTCWASEVGVNLPIVNANGTDEGRDITYAPVPFFLNNKGYGFYLSGFNYSKFDFAKSDGSTLNITNNAGDFEAFIYPADAALDIIGEFSKQWGNYSLPKPWVFGVWAAAGTDWQSHVNGQDVNYSVLKTCRSNHIPLSAIFAEDWYFDFLSLSPIEDWTLNRKYYPDYEKMIADQHLSGVKNIGYFLPYIGKNKTLFKLNNSFIEADKQGLFTKDIRGNSYVFKFFIWDEAQFDFSDPRAVDWFHSKFYSYLESKGVDGWMNDFGEYNSRSFNGEMGSTMHNKYPLLWAKTAHDFFIKRRPNADFCIFSRSGAAGLQQYNAFIFTGDRNATYDPLSGLGGQITGVLNGCMSVHPNVSIDIGAYNCEKTSPMNKLMMFRWIEMGALIPVMRLHRGLQLCDNWRFDEDTETLMQWKKYATLHAKLFPYIYTIAQQAADHGWPMVRHPAFYYPSDTNSLKQNFEFLLGDRILSCPVIDEKENLGRSDMSQARQTWKVYLPPGNWYYYWTNMAYTGGAYYEVPAAPGFLPMFIKEGTIVPTYDKPIDTFVQGVDDPSISDFEVADSSMEILFYGYGKDALTLWDGTVITCSRVKGKPGIYEIKNGHNRNYKVTFID